MKLEDCTKEELIYFIRHRCFMEMDRLEFDVLMARAESVREKQSKEFDLSQKAMSEYIKILKPYEGKSYSDVPDEVFETAVAIAKRREKHIKNYDRLQRKYDELQKQIDRNLYEEDKS